MTGAGGLGAARGGRGGPYTCQRCGAERLHRSHPRTTLESLGSSLLRLRIYRCHACELRVRTFSRPERSGTDPVQPGSGRRSERRDVVAARRMRVRIAVMALTATLIGTAVALWFVVD